MATVKQYTSAGAAAADLTVDDAQLVLEKGAQALKDAVVAIRNGMRAGSASTKSKGEVAGSNKKPWKQKGTGNARAGFRQSPVWRGGGVAHMRLAFARALSEKIASGNVAVVSEFKFEAPKTKLMAAFLKQIGVDRTALVVTGAVDENILKMTGNLPRAAAMSAAEVDVYTLMRFKTLVADKAGFDALMARMGGKESK